MASSANNCDAAGTTTSADENCCNGAPTTETDAREAAAKFDYVRFTFSDFHGIGRCKAVQRKHFDQFFSDGITAFCGMLAFGPRSEVIRAGVPSEAIEQKLGNMSIKPVPGTLHALPWAGDGTVRVGEVFCETFWRQAYRDGVAQEACPRYMARKQLDRLAKLGYKLFSGYEAEMLICDASGKPVNDGGDYLVCTSIAEAESFLYAANQKMAAAGIDILTFEKEHGPGQFELVTNPKYGIETADQLFRLKHAMKELARQNGGWQVTFMSQPSPDLDSNGLHFSHSLWSLDNGTNAFYDANSPDSLSALAKHWVAGLIHHGPALSAVCCPTVNCYRRFGHSPVCPSRAYWAVEDRGALVRVKAGSSKGTYMENRLPSGLANPYLVMAATLAAGIDGLVNKLECPAYDSVFQGDQWERSTSEAFKKLPANLTEALEALQQDKALCEGLGEEFVRWFVGVKREVEIMQVSKAGESGKTDIEVEREMYWKFL